MRVTHPVYGVLDMNILNVAELLDSVRIAEVVHGAVAVQRCNSALPEEHHFPTDADGNTLALMFDQMPEQLQQTLETLEVLMETEVDEFVQAVTRLKDRARERQKSQDATVLSVGGYLSVISVVIALGYILIYVFHSLVDGDGIQGAMFNFLVYLFNAFNESVMKK